MESDKLNLWFGLSYANYLTIPRSIMTIMSEEWQNKMADLLEELDESLDWRPQDGCYWVHLKDDHGKFKHDDFNDYRHLKFDPEKIRRKK
jgi:hypothetical protein